MDQRESELETWRGRAVVRKVNSIRRMANSMSLCAAFTILLLVILPFLWTRHLPVQLAFLAQMAFTAVMVHQSVQVSGRPQLELRLRGVPFGQKVKSGSMDHQKITVLWMT